MVMVARGTGTRKTDLYPSMTAFTTKTVKDMKKLTACRNPPRLNRPCLRPDWRALTLNEGDTKFQTSKTIRTIASANNLIQPL